MPYTYTDWSVIAGETPTATKWNQLGDNDNYLKESILPIGCIVMWSGAIADIPTNFALCDGDNGTPDLRGKFVVGAHDDTGGDNLNTYDVDDTGGETKHTLSVAEMPSHDHGGYTGYTANTNFNSKSEGHGNKSNYSMSTQYYDDNWTSFNHRHTIPSQGSGTAHENRPPYYALAYIMRVS